MNLAPFPKNILVLWEPPLNLPLSGGEDNFPPLQGEGWGGVMSLIEKIFLKIQHHLIETALENIADANRERKTARFLPAPCHIKTK